MNKMFGMCLSALAAAALQACGGSGDPTANALSSNANVDASSSAAATDAESRTATATDASVDSESNGDRAYALAVNRARECATTLGSGCVAASPVIDTSASSWVLSQSGSGTNGAIGQASGLVSARSMALNYQFACYSTSSSECARVTATSKAAKGYVTASALTLSIRGPLNADIRVTVCDSAGQCFEYDARRATTAQAGVWSLVVIDLSKPRSRSGAAGSGKLGSTATSLAISSVASTSGLSSGWLEIDGLQFVNPAKVAVAAVAAVVPVASVTNTVAAAGASVAAPVVSATAPVTAAVAPTIAAPVASVVAVAAAPAVAAPLVTADSPMVFNATDSARAGDIITVQGTNFGVSPQAYLSDASGGNVQALTVVNKVGTTWLAAQVPSSATGAFVLRVVNGALSSAPVKLNAALPHHIDALQIAPGGVFRVFGRNLMMQGSTPSVTVNGAPAMVNTSSSDENMLVVTAPASLQPDAAASIAVDNGNGSGASTLDRRIVVQAGQYGDALGLAVGWTNAFSAFANKTTTVQAACNGSTNDSPAIQAAIDAASSSAGGVVQLPAGNCRIVNGIALRSNTVLQGMGKDLTRLTYEGNYPLVAMNIDLFAVRNLSVVNSGSVEEGAIFKNNTRAVLQNVRFDLKASRQMFLTDNNNMVVTGSEFIQGGSVNGNGPYVFIGTGGLAFTNNTTTWVGGANSFERTHDSWFAGNTFTRDGSYQAASGTVHSFTMDFAHRIAVVGNTFNVKNGPITNLNRNDGETILTEGGGASRTENLGTLASAAGDSFVDGGNALNIDPFSTGTIPENYGVAIVSGKGAGQHRRVISYAQGKVTVDRSWDVVPDSGSHYATFVWGLEKSLIKNNVLSQNPRGIWLYHTALRDVAVVGNQISEGGGIYLRSYQNLSTKTFQPMYNVRIASNTIRNTTRLWASHINAVFVNTDGKSFGTAMTGIDIRDNRVVANSPNVELANEEYAGTEGFMNMMRMENGGALESSVSPRILGTLFQRNSCENCDVGIRLGTGDLGVTLWFNSILNSTKAVDDWATSNTRETSVSTLIK